MSTEMIKFYKIAGISYQVVFDKRYDYADEGVLTEYVSQPEQNSHIIRIEITETLPPPKGELVFEDNNKSVYLTENGTQLRYEGGLAINKDSAYMCVQREAELTYVYVKPRSFGSKTVLKAMELEHFTAVNNEVLFHASYISVDGKGIIFTAPSGVGKSTQAALWVKHNNAEFVNGDRCVLVSAENDALVCGVPYCGSSRVNHNVTCKLSAIVYLKQAPENACTILKGLTAFKKLWEGICVNIWNRADVEAVVKTVTHLAERVPVILLECKPDASAVKVLQSFLREMNIFD